MSITKLNDTLPLLENVRQIGKGYTSLCPSHTDNKNSLTLSEAEDGKLLLKCHAGCSFQQVIAALNIPINVGGKSNEIETIYDYKDENGNLLYQNVRLAGKNFRWRHFDETGRGVWNLNNVQRVPYQLPELTGLPVQNDFLMAEGEKDADTLKKNGLIATNHKNWQANYNYLLKNKQVIIFQDHDRAGVDQALKVANTICNDAAAVKIVDCFAAQPLADKHGKDVSDYLQTHSIDELLKLIKNTGLWKPLVNKELHCSTEEQGLKVICLSDVIAEEIVWLWKPYIPVGEFTIVEGIEGLGKSWISCALASAVAEGKKLPFSDSKPIAPGNVLMLSAEDSLSHTVKPRLVSMNAKLDSIFALDEVFSLDNPIDLIKFEAVIAEYEPKLVIVDPLFSYTGGKNLNTESDSRPLARKLIAIAQKFDCAIVGVRHIGKAKGNGDARAAGLGSVAWRASARSVLMVGKDEETGEKALCQTKNNLAEESKISVGFEIENGKFYWKAAPSNLTKERMLAQPKDDEAKAEQTEAVAFLREILRDGEKQSKNIDKEAKEAGISQYAVRKARSTLSVETFKKGGHFGGEKGWFMRLPKSDTDDSEVEDADCQNSRHLQSNLRDKTSYNNNITEDVEIKSNQHLQQVQTTSSNGLVAIVQMKAKCKCGAYSNVGEVCLKCQKVLIPF